MAEHYTLRGYLLEESLAWLLRGSGYQLLVNAADDPVELVAQGQELRVRGRGTSHQVDVLGELAFTPAFSLPVRLFLEAKYYDEHRPCGLKEVRNAHGVVHDVNENYMTRAGNAFPQRRYHYAYALFSTGGFTKDAQEYALAHQISLIDLAGESFEWLRTPIAACARKLHKRQQTYGVKSFPVAWMRTRLRALLTTAQPGDMLETSTNAPLFAAAVDKDLARFVEIITEHQQAQLILGFPAAPFILSLAAADKQAFAAYAFANPSHKIRLVRGGHGASAEWTITALEDPDAYTLTFSLPEHIESWISDSEEERLIRTRAVKSGLLSSITIYDTDGEEQLVYRLRYAPGSLRRDATAQSGPPDEAG